MDELLLWFHQVVLVVNVMLHRLANEYNALAEPKILHVMMSARLAAARMSDDTLP